MKTSELIKEQANAARQGWTATGGNNACSMCRADDQQNSAYPAPGMIETCPPGYCRVCWYRYGRSVPHGIKAVSDRGKKQDIGDVADGHTKDSANIAYGDW